MFWKHICNSTIKEVLYDLWLFIGHRPGLLRMVRRKR